MWIKKLFDSVNGNPSSKRVMGALTIVCGLALAFLKCICNCPVDDTLVLGILTIGSGLIATGVAEKKHIQDGNQ